MSISSVGGGLPAAYRLPGTGAAPHAAAPAAPARPAAPLRAPEAADAPPAGSDPKLWSVLTAEERSYFRRMAELGAVTYAPGQRAAQPPAAAAPLGNRVDVRA